MNIYESDRPTIELASEIHGESAMLEGFDYVEETELTASNVFSPENVGVIELTAALSAVIHSARLMDKYKKALFRQRSREESGLPPEFQPGEVLLTAALAHADHPVEGEYDDLFHGIIGIVTETGELAEILYDFLVEGKKPDVVNVREEMGDQLWYGARLIKWAKTTYLTEMKRNIAKLRKRHGTSGFSKSGDINRDLAGERELLEGHVHEGLADHPDDVKEPS